MGKKVLPLLFLCFAMSVAGCVPVAEQQHAGIGMSINPIKVGVIDMQRCQKNSKSFQNATSAMKIEFDSITLMR